MDRCTNISAKQLRDFEALTEVSQEQLLASSEVLNLPKGTVVFKENEYLSKLYCIRSGACKFSKYDESGQEHILRFLGEGEVMGKRSIISKNGARVTATTLMDTQLCCVDRDLLVKHMEHNTRFCQDLLRAFIEDVNLNDQNRIIFSPGKSIRERLAKLLVYLTEKYGTDAAGKLKLRLKREDMAVALGTSQEYIINLLKRFKNFGLIDTKKSEIYVRSIAGLRQEK